MDKRMFFAPILVLALAAMACNFSFDINLPDIRTMEVGPTVEENISIPYPVTSGTPALEIAFGAGDLTINPGATQDMVEGTALYNVANLKPQVVTEGNRVKLQQGEGRIDTLPTFSNRMEMEWDLKLSDEPMALTLNAGAVQSNIELGGLSLTSLRINQGAADSRVSFSAPNLVEMESLEVNAGAANINLYGLAFTNVADRLTFKGGAGNYTLSFDGELQDDMRVTIDAGLGNLIVIVPAGVSAEVETETALTNINHSGGWEKSGNRYTQSGPGPRLIIRITMGAGNLDLRN
jgi:hypothetical protein